MTTKPEIEFPDGPAPTELVIKDLVVGDGPEAESGGTVEVHYQGKLTTLHDHEQWASDDLSTLATPNATTPSEADYEAVAQHETIHGYLELAHGQGRWAEVAFYAAARLAADQHDVRASALLELYLRRFPSGANATDARQLLTRLKGE